MKKTLTYFLLIFSLITNAQNSEKNKALIPKLRSLEKPSKIYGKAKKEGKKYFNLQTNPEVSLNLLDYLKNLSLPSTSNINWFEAGPNNVGGRTRAVVVDRTNSNIVLAAGVSGGIWRTSNGGNSWSLKSNVTDNFNITSIVQHPTIATIWYASSGEFSSTSNFFFNNTVLGSGVLYKSIDNGVTWQNVAPPQSPQNYLYLTSRLAISPTTSTIFVATNGFGIARSTDGGATFNIVLGSATGSYNLTNTSSRQHCDVVVNQNGVLLAQISGELSLGAGFYKSVNDGVTWTNITPATFTPIAGELDIERSVFAIAPSNQNVAYAYTNSISGAMDYQEDNIHFHKINISNGTFEDRSHNLVKLSYSSGEIYRLPSAQYNYDMVLAVKPNDENFVVIAGQSGPFRSTTGFATDAGTYNSYWYGTNSVESSQSYVSRTRIHLDFHALFFDPQNPNKLWCGHDGGISAINDATANNNVNAWISKNNGFNVTQFYDVAIAPIGQGNKVMGASQDNASPSLIWNENQTSPLYTMLVSGGDGASSNWQNNYIFTTGSGGDTPSIFSTNLLDPMYYNSSTNLTFPNAEGLLSSPYSLSHQSQFISVNPNNENVIYVAKGMWEIFRGTNANNWLTLSASQIQSQFQTFNIDLLGSNLNFYGFSDLTYGNSDVLYFSLSKMWEGYPVNGNLPPKIYKLQNASTTSISSAVEISSPLFTNDSYVVDIVLNSSNNNEFIVVFASKTGEGVFHTTNGGVTYQSIRGNLSLGTYAPSFTCAEIVNTPNGTIYLLGTSMGLFSTTQLSGNTTMWQNEALDKIGSSIISDIDYRNNDSMIAVSTHGRGIFMGNASNLVLSNNDFQLNSSGVYPNPFDKETTVVFDQNYNNGVELIVFDITGKKVKTIKESTPIVTNQQMELNLSDIKTSGIYLLKVYDSSNYKCVKTYKLIKN